MKNYDLLFADLDGTLIDTISGNTFPKGVWDMKFKFEVLDAIKKLAPKHLWIVSNQGGIKQGYVNEPNFIRKINYIATAISEYTGVEIVYYSYCDSNDKEDRKRKPNTGMLEDACYLMKMKARKFKILMIGDASGKEGQFSDSDRKCAENFGIDYLDVEDFVKEMTGCVGCYRYQDGECTYCGTDWRECPRS